MSETFRGRFKLDGGFDFGVQTLRLLKKYIKENPNRPFDIVPILPESKDQRGWFEGALCPLVTFYQEGMDHHNTKDVKEVREWLKTEFNSDLVTVNGKTHKIAQSTKRKLNLGFLERCVEWVTENYAPPQEALDPKKYDDWHDRLFMEGGPDNYLDYLIKIGILKK